MKCIIIGLGNFGMALAQRLTAMGYEVIGVDKDIDKVNAYKDSIKNTICLNLNNEQAARNLPLKDADLNIVSLGKDAGASILTVAILKQNGAKRIIVRAISTLHKTVLEAMGRICRFFRNKNRINYINLFLSGITGLLYL